MMRGRWLSVLLVCIVVLGGAAAGGSVEATASKPLVTGPLAVQILEPSVLESSPALRWYEPENLAEGTFLFAHEGHRALLLVKPCGKGQRWVLKTAVGDAESIVLKLAPKPVAGSSDWRTEPLLVQLPQVDARDGRALVVRFESE